MENWQREQQYNREQQGSIERIREKAKYDAENWEKSYTKEDTTRMMRIDKWEAEAISNPAFGENEKRQVREQAAFARIGIPLTSMPRQYTKGKEPGAYFEEAGVGWRVNKDGEPIVVDDRGTVRGDAFRAKTTLDHFNLTTDAANETAYTQHQHEQTMGKLKMVSDLMKEDIEDGTETVKDKSGKETTIPKTRKRNSAESIGIVNELFGTLAPLAPQQSRRITGGAPATPQQGQQQRGDLRSRAGQVSPGGKYVWDGTRWVPNQKR
jgi:hypothetical protein